jgi:uncharacterized repeat protein (TIGR04138 family)
MQEASDLDAIIRQLCAKDRRYAPEAYHFLLEALEYTMRSLGRHRNQDDNRHVGGRELLEGIRQYGLNQFGPLAPTVFHSFGIYKTDDFGVLVFRLVEAGHLRCQESDSIEDFMDGYDFHDAFVREYRSDMSDVRL